MRAPSCNNRPPIDWTFVNKAPPSPLFTDRMFRKHMAFLNKPFGSISTDRVFRKRFKIEQGQPLEPSCPSSPSSECVITCTTSKMFTLAEGTALDTMGKCSPLCRPKVESLSSVRASSPESSLELDLQKKLIRNYCSLFCGMTSLAV